MMNCDCRLCLAQSIRRYDIAEEEARSRILDEPNEGVHHTRLANILLLQDRIDEAHESARKGIEYSPDCPDALYWLAEVRQQMGFYDEAEEILRRGIELDPEDQDLWERLAAIFNFRNEYETALEYGKEAVQLDPEFVHGHMAVVESHCFLDPFTDEAELALTTLMQLAPDDANAHELKAIMLVEQGEPDLALESVYAALAIDPIDDHVLNTALALETDPVKLRQLADQSAGLNLGVIELNLTVVLTYIGLQLDKEAIDVLKEVEIDAKLVNGTQGSVYVEMATVLRQYDLIMEFCEFVTEFDQEKLSMVDAAKAAVACEKRDYETAYEHACRATELDPENFDAIWGKVFAEIATGKHDDARESAELLMNFEPVSGHFIVGVMEAINDVKKGDEFLQYSANEETTWRDLTTTRCDAILDLVELGHQQPAMELFSILEEDHGQSCETWCTLSIIELWNGDTKAAEASFEKATAIEPTCIFGAEIYRRAFWLFHEKSGRPIEYYERPEHWGPVEVANG